MADVSKGNSLRPHRRHCAGAGADRRCQSTPATSHCHCLGTHLPACLVCLRPDGQATVQPAQAHPDAGAIPAQQLEAGTAAIGKRIGRAVAWRAAQRLLPVQRLTADPGTHVDCRRHQSDRICRQPHHKARIRSASQLAGTSPGGVNVHQSSPKSNFCNVP